MTTSQTVPTSKKMVRPKTFTLKLRTEKKTTTKYLSGINDSLIQLSTKRVTFSNSIIENPSYKTYNYSEIEKVNIRTYGSVGRGIGYGALIGAGVGGIIGLASYHRDPYSWFDIGPGVSAIAGAIISVIPGMIIGGIIGSKSKKFFIHRNKENFGNMKTSILEMALSKNGHVARDSAINNYVSSFMN
ncbi:MAG: hypothetical protein ABI208_04690 [Ginsengibacter sp.]